MVRQQLLGDPWLMSQLREVRSLHAIAPVILLNLCSFTCSHSLSHIRDSLNWPMQLKMTPLALPISTVNIPNARLPLNSSANVLLNYLLRTHLMSMRRDESRSKFDKNR